MNSSERVYNTFKHHTVDRVPVHHIGFSSQIASMILNREAYIGGGIQQWREAKALWEGETSHKEFLERSSRDAFDICRVLEMDIVRPSYWRLHEKPAKKIDDHTFLYGSESNWHIRKFSPEYELFEIVESYPAKKEFTFEDLEKDIEKKEAGLSNYKPTPEFFPDVLAAIKAFGNEKAIRLPAGSIGIPIDSIWMEAIYLRPDLVRRYLNTETEIALKDIECLSNMGVKYLFGGKDMACNTGPVYSPAIFRDFMVPVLKQVTEACHAAEMYYLFCSDGNLWPVANDLFSESGIDGYVETDRLAGMDLTRLRMQFPKLTVIGNISSITLHTGRKEDVIHETLSCLEVAKSLGGVIVGCSNFVVPGTPAKNVHAMLETISRYR